MIFVTVGTTIPFDSLIREMDDLCEKKVINEQVICQIGNGEYEPSHCEYHRFLPNLDELIQDASLVIGHGGTGTTFELLVLGQQFISVANPMAADDHQEKFLERLSSDVELIWTNDPKEIVMLISQARALGERQNRLPSLIPSLSRYIDGISQE